MSGSSPPTRHVTQVPVVAVRGGRAERRDDRLAGEQPLAIRAGGPGEDPVDVAITMRTPGDEAALAVGFLHAEGLIAGPDDVGAIEVGSPTTHAQPDDEVTVRLTRPLDLGAVAVRHFVATAACGICGKASIDAVVARCAPIPPGPVVDAATILALPARLRAAQSAFELTGGLHAAGLFDAAGRLVDVREDVGRHNALDTIAGWMWVHGVDGGDKTFYTTGRLTSEMVMKAAQMGVPIVVSRNGVTQMGHAFASRLGMTLFGRAANRHFICYTGFERFDSEPEPLRSPVRVVAG